MVSRIDTKNINRRGLIDWILQRLSAILIGLYTLFILGYLVLHPHVQFNAWSALFNSGGMIVFTLVTVIAIAIHAWIGLWTVFTDYVKPKGVRLFLQALVIIVLALIVIWCVAIV